MRLTARGKALLVVAALLLVGGSLLGMPLLRALAGVALGAVLVAVVPHSRPLRPTIHREVHPSRLQRGEAAVARLVVANDTGRRLPAFVALDMIGGVEREVAVRALAAGAGTWHVYDLPTRRRGRVTVGPLAVERTDLLGLVRSRAQLGEVEELWVHPRRHPVRLLAAGRSRHHHEGDPPPGPVAGSTDLRSLREYVPGDPLRHVYWKASARTGQLMVREYTDPAQPWCVVLLDDEQEALAPTAFEEAVEVAASILWEAAEQGRPVRLATTSGVRLDAAGGVAGVRAVLDRLCVLGQERRTGAMAVADLTPRRGEGWFVHIGGPPTTPVAALAQRFGRAALVDLSGGAAGDDATTVRAADAAAAVRSLTALARP